jgi:hypothetical protein
MDISRRHAVLASLAGLPPVGVSKLAAQATRAVFQIERWGLFEQVLQATATGNPFDVPFAVTYRHGNRTVETSGFHDGDNSWRFRFSPDAEGEWTWTTRSTLKDLDGQTGRFVCSPPSGANHGPAVVRNTYHFAYADGTKYVPFGTTCYAWTHQTDALEEQTLSTLRTSGFNKMRMCVFPKWYTYNHGEPPRHPFERDAAGNPDYTRFHPAFFRHLETRVGQLRDLGIEADLILFHPYDNWGYQKMPADADDRYLRYLCARMSAYRNVWWSMANEWDLMKFKTLADFDRYFRIVQENDPYQRLRSVHHSKVMYDHGKPWVTHVSLQDDDFSKTQFWLDSFRKPVLYDECKYEGNIPQRWGNISAQEMVRRFWLAVTAGAYGGHGETYLNSEGWNSEGVLWWSKGGSLRGESAPRIAFLRRLLEEGPVGGLNPLPNAYYPGAAKAGEYYLFYLDYHQPVESEFALPENVRFQAEVVDPWRMTIAPVAGTFTGKSKLKLPGAPYLAVRFRRSA